MEKWGYFSLKNCKNLDVCEDVKKKFFPQLVLSTILSKNKGSRSST